jgi:acetoin utilization deacetylase AcuC-like enzyme
LRGHKGTDGERDAILDCDAHDGDGTDAIIGTLGIDWVEHHTQGSQFGMGTDAANGAYERWLETAIDKCSGCSVVLYQAGADPHINAPLGGTLTTQQMRARDQWVFERLGHLPMGWNLPGGYQVVAGKAEAEQIEPVLDLHRETGRFRIEKFG